MTLTPTALPTLVLLNGIARGAQRWSSVISALDIDAPLALDGVGAATGASACASVPEQARQVIAQMDAEGIEAADVIGFSHGGLIAQQLAITAPNRVRRLMLLATSCGAGSVLPSHSWSVGPVSLDVDADVSDVPALAGQAIAISAWSSIPFLGSITAPTLVVHGLRDQIVPIANGRLLARRIPGATMVELDCGHDLQHPRNAGVVASAIRGFLGTAPRH